MRLYKPHEQRGRALRARGVVAVFLGILVMSLFRAQILRSEDWVLQSESNRLRSLTEPAPRGIIRDRTGKVLADNVPGYSVSVLPAEPDSMVSTLERLREHLRLSDERMDVLVERARARPGRPLLVSVSVAFDAVSAIQERRVAFPRVLIETRPRRRYLAGPAAAHLVGYVGEINEDELDSEAFEEAEPGTIVGRAGVENAYEPLLQGRSGTRYVEVDARGRIVGSFLGQPGASAQPGMDIGLTLDLDLMNWIHEIFPDTMSGSVVALDVETGGVLALYSAPTYDPNVFTGVLNQDVWDGLTEDPKSPLLNRALMGRYPPGSPWKLATAAIALEAGVIEVDEEMPIACEGSLRYGNGRFNCWDRAGHGPLDLVGAIQHSCNVYFYQVGLRIGLVNLLREGNRLGFGDRCNVDLPQEVAGVFPQGVEFWEDRFGYRATEGEVISLVIGQGPNSQTPIKMAQFLLAIARDGSAPAPTVYQGANGGEAWRLDVSRESLEAIREGLRRVTEEGGTAHMASLEHFDLMGKTGTAQSGPTTANHAWFTGMAGPKGADPEIVVVVLVEFGESGSAVAAPLMAKVADYYLRAKHGIPQDSIQTLGEHIRAGRDSRWGFQGRR
ncbi:MAG: penicillin-binding protein 2 [Longimicrobiales bacterium]